METSEKPKKKVKQQPAAPKSADKEVTGGRVEAGGRSVQPDKPSSSSAGEDARRPSEEWIAEVSHELRLPIANIRLLVETLLDGAVDDPLVARRMLTRTQAEVERLQSLVVNLLSIEQVSNARELMREWISLEPRARYAVETTSKAANEKGVTVVMEIAPTARVFANPQQLDQVILNLVENAVKFTPSGGTVRIRAGAEDGCFSVDDTGIGMAAHEIPKIFQRFYRIDRAQSRGSTGLGLSIVKHIVDMHGAKISVKSKQGAGSSFSLEFPGPQASRGRTQ